VTSKLKQEKYSGALPGRIGKKVEQKEGEVKGRRPGGGGALENAGCKDGGKC